MENDLEYKKHLETIVQYGGSNLKDVPEKFKTYELCTMAVKKNGWALEFVPERLKIDKLCESAVKSVGFALKFVPEELRTKELCTIAIENDYTGYALEYVPIELRTREFCAKAVDKLISDPYTTSEERLDYITSIIPKEFWEESVTQDTQYVKNGIKEEILNLKEGEINMENNKEYQGWIESTQEKNWTLAWVPEDMRTEEMCEYAVLRDGINLRDVPDEIITPSICEVAVKDYGQALGWVPEELRTKELCEIALAQGYLADELLEAFVPEEFKEELAEKYDLYLEPKAKGR